MATQQRPGAQRVIYPVMIGFKFVLGIIGIALIAVTAAYSVGLKSYDSKYAPTSFEGHAITYIPVPPNQTTTYFYYRHSSRSQFALGALTVIHVLSSLLVYCCFGRKGNHPKLVPFGWISAGLVNALVAIVAVGLTFDYNSKSASLYPNGPQNYQYFQYGEYTDEAWVCGNGKTLVQLVGSSQSVSDFQKYCNETTASKWISVLIVLLSLFMMTAGIVTLVLVGRTSRQSKLKPYSPPAQFGTHMEESYEKGGV